MLANPKKATNPKLKAKADNLVKAEHPDRAERAHPAGLVPAVREQQEQVLQAVLGLLGLEQLVLVRRVQVEQRAQGLLVVLLQAVRQRAAQQRAVQQLAVQQRLEGQQLEGQRQVERRLRVALD